MLVVCVIAGAFYSTAVCAVFPVVVDAGLDKYFNSANSGANVVTTLQGSSNNPNNGIITFNWSCNGGSLSNPNASSTTFTVPYTTQKISYTCTLKAADNYGMSDTDNVIIYLNNNGTSSSTVVTIPANNISKDRATLHGSFNADNANYLVWFQWGTTIAYGTETNHQIVIDSSDWSFSQKIESLAPNTQYHFRAVAQKQSNKQMYYGQDMAFYTTSDNVTVTLPPSTTPAPSASNPPPTTVSTGITDDFLKDSFFLPLLALILISWIFIVRYKRSKGY